MQIEEPCLVCGTLTNLTCGGCELRYYCKRECQAEDRNYHLAECQSGQIGAFWGIGKWKSILLEHADLIASQSENIAMVGMDSDNLKDTYDKLELNAMRWTKGRSVTTAQLQWHVKKVNTAFKKYAHALFLNDTTRMKEWADETGRGTGGLSEFFSDNIMFGSTFNSRRDYERAFAVYEECLRKHALYADQYQRSKDPQDKISRDTQRRECKQVADAVGAVLNGRPWKNPLL